MINGHEVLLLVQKALLKGKKHNGSACHRKKGTKTGEPYQLREPHIPYGFHFGIKKDDIGPENLIFGTLIFNIQEVVVAQML